MLIINSETDIDKQKVLADRACNPNIQDICRLFIEWRKRNYGEEDGTKLFVKLQAQVDEYNSKNGKQGGKALLQWYETTAKISDSEDENTPKPKKRKREISQKPLILALITPLMARAHCQIQQAGEIAFCDSTASLDRFNTSIFIISTATAMSGIPLAVLLTSDEREDTVYNAFELLKEVLPPFAFFGNGPSVGPQVFMIDDSVSERLAIEKAWPSTTILLCTFHFLQRRWTWLHDGKNRVQHSDRLVLIKRLQNMVYASNEETLTRLYNDLLEKTGEATKYPSFLQQLRSLWEKRQAWAHCYRTTIPIRGNHTNNYAEAGIIILKELIFSRVKAYNLVQMFSFITEIMEMFYQKKLLSLANNRIETYVALRFQGITSQKVAREDIKLAENGWYSVLHMS